jgi:Flp pilus assembly protein TadD
MSNIQQSLQINDMVAMSHVLRGRVMMELGDLEGATSAFATAETIDPNSVDAQYFQGVIAERVDRKDEALTRYTKAAELDGTNPQYAVAAAEMMIDLGRVKDAEKYLVERRAAFDNNAGVRQLLGHLAMINGQADQAVELLNEARLLAPDSQAITEDLIRAQIATGRNAEAESLLSRLLSDDANKARRDLLSLRARALTGLNRLMEAREILLSLTTGSAGATDVSSWSMLGQLAFKLNDPTRARQAAGRLIAMAPDSADGYVLRALLQRRTGDLEAARSTLNDCVNRVEDPAALTLLGLVNSELKDADGARAALARVLKKDPGNEKAVELLAAIDHADNIANAPATPLPTEQ